MPLIQNMVKGSRWRLVSPLVVGKQIVPEGEVFEVMYPRRRAHQKIAVRFTRFNFNITRSWSKRFPKAHAVVPFDKITDVELVVRPTVAISYYIRRLKDWKVWTGGSKGVSSYFADFRVEEANSFISWKNAQTGLANVVFTQGLRQRLKDGECPYEVALYDNFEDTWVSRSPMGEMWYRNILALGKLAEKTGTKGLVSKTNNAIETFAELRIVSTKLEDDQRLWRAVVVMDYNGFTEAFWEKFNRLGITDYQVFNNRSMLLLHDGDRVMFRMAFAYDVDMYDLEVDR